MPKSDLPEDISQRLDDAIRRCVGDIGSCVDKLREEVGRMFRFANMGEVEAARIILTERGMPLHVETIVQELKAGGIFRPATGSKGSSADAEIRRSLSRAATHGVNLKFTDREKEIIGLADWVMEKSTP